MHSNLNRKAFQHISGNVIKVLAISVAVSLTGCQTFKGANKNTDDFETADNTAEGYYTKAREYIEDDNLNSAEAQLKDLQLFYPSGKYAQQALLDTMYVQFKRKKYEDAVASAEQFVRLYPGHKQADYAYYVQGVANMSIPTSGFNIINKNQAERDTSHYRLAYSKFVQLLQQHPNSTYAADSAQRMTYLFNQFAEHQLHIAKWYIKRGAYVASANRAKQVFQNYPKSESVPEAIAILAYSYDMLELTDMSNEYKNLLRINYPDKLTADGKVILESSSSLLQQMSMNPFSEEADSLSRPKLNVATKPQVISSRR